MHPLAVNYSKFADSQIKRTIPFLFPDRSIATSLNEIGERQGKDYDDLFKRISFM